MLDRVRFIQNQKIVRENESALAFRLFVRLAQQHEQQSVIDHYDIGRLQTFRALADKNNACRWPHVFLRADVRLAANLRPNFRIWLDRQIAERTVARCARPFRQSLQLILLRPGEKLVGLLQRAFQSARAKIILAALSSTRPRTRPEESSSEWGCPCREVAPED